MRRTITVRAIPRAGDAETAEVEALALQEEFRSKERAHGRLVQVVDSLVDGDYLLAIYEEA